MATVALPLLHTDSVPGPNIAFLDWDDALMTLADRLCRNWSETGATCIVSSDRAWNADSRNDDGAGSFLSRSTYPAPVRDAADTAAQRVIYDRADKKRDNFLSAAKI